MPQQRLPAVFMRGGTSKAVMFHRRDLPGGRDDWNAMFLRMLGSPDPNGRQLNGMGGGVSSLSKVCVIGPPSRADADVDYTFAQVGVHQAMVDYSGNCGNMSSAVGPFAIDEGLVTADGASAAVRIHNTNTGKIIVSRFGLTDGVADVEGDFVLDGVAGSGAPIQLDFLAPGGSGGAGARLLPTGHAADTLEVEGLGPTAVSMVDAATPCVFLHASALGLRGDELPQEIDSMPDVLAKLGAIRKAASIAMGLADSPEAAERRQSIPKIGFVQTPGEVAALSGHRYPADAMDLQVRMLSMGQPHRAVPLTAALCLAAACRIPGSIPHQVLGPVRQSGPGKAAPLRIAHPSGVVTVDATTSAGAGGIEVESVTVFRTARRLFEGQIYF